jgi:HlyD family secretion protein
MSTNVASSSGVSSKLDSLRIPEGERATSGGSSRLGMYLVWTAVLLLIGGGYVAYTRNPPWLQAVRGAEYETGTVVTMGREEIALELSGFVVPYRKVTVSSRLPGSITQVTFDVGQKVQEGELLAQLDDSTFQVDLQQAKAALQASQSRLDEMRNGALPEELEQARTAVDVAKSKVELATNEAERAEQLGDSTVQAELDVILGAKSDAEANLRTMEQKLRLLEKGIRPERIKGAEADVAQAQALVAKATKNIDNARILSPLTGTVIERHAEVGEIVRPEALVNGLCVVADLTTMEVEVDVQERDLQKVEVGRSGRIIPDAYPDRMYTAKVQRIQPLVSRQRGVVRVTLRIDQADQYLLPDMNVRALIENPPSATPVAETLWIPEAAVSPEADSSVVFRLDGERAVRTEVKLGEKEGKRVQVVSGLSAGETVVLPGGRRLVDGQTVRLKGKSK